jgi:hypothetical protein
VSSRLLNIQNNGPCQATIVSAGISGPDANVFSFTGLPPSGFPVTLQTGELLGDGNLKVLFKPLIIKRLHTAQVDVTYVDDPTNGHTTTVHIPLYGEGVTTGLRALIRIAGAPAANVEKLQLQRIVGNRNVSNEVLQNVAPVHIAGPVPELTFNYHREWGAASNTVQILTGNYSLTATVVVGKKRVTKAVYFSLDTCTFNPNVVIDF